MTRPPIVVVLGHVDHGKTTLLDYIRKTDVAAGEAGAITQHIGAYQVTVEPSSRATERGRGIPPKNKKKILRGIRLSSAEVQAQDDRVDEIHTITFIDTPGHEAFAKMRSRGASVADIAILVVAANDGVMPQTKEAIRHIKQAKIPVIVAINKIDLPEIKLEKVKKQLVKEDILLEGYGGDVVSMPISAKTGKGVDELLEMIILIAEMEKISADPKSPFEAVVIESKMDPHRGPVASIIVKKGTLHQGDEIFIDNKKSKIRAMINDKAEQIKEALPSTPVEISGLEIVPEVGSIITSAIGQIAEPEETEKIETTPVVDENTDAKEPPKIFKVMLKADVQGTLEAILASLNQGNLQIIKSDIGDINDSDILLARTTGAFVIGFNVKINPSVTKLAETERVKFKIYQIIYKLLEELSDVTTALAEPTKIEILGKAEIIAEFVNKKIRVAGAKVIEGRLALGDRIKVLRADKEIGQARIKSLRFKKESINKAELGQECGILLEPQLDFNVGDIVISPK
ncbi:MAG: translation initiation factor IF-2 [Candidatus Gottesmanbacteria bacterium]